MSGSERRIKVSPMKYSISITGPALRRFLTGIGSQDCQMSFPPEVTIHFLIYPSYENVCSLPAHILYVQEVGTICPSILNSLLSKSKRNAQLKFKCCFLTPNLKKYYKDAQHLKNKKYLHNFPPFFIFRLFFQILKEEGKTTNIYLGGGGQFSFAPPSHQK